MREKRERVTPARTARIVHVGTSTSRLHGHVSCWITIYIHVFAHTCTSASIYSGNRKARLIGRALQPTLGTVQNGHSQSVPTEIALMPGANNASFRRRIGVGALHGTGVNNTRMHGYPTSRYFMMKNVRTKSGTGRGRSKRDIPSRTPKQSTRNMRVMKTERDEN